MSNKPQRKNKPKRTNGKSPFTVGTLPSLRASSVDVLRPLTQHGETYRFDLQLVPLYFQPNVGILKQRYQFQSASVSLTTQLFTIFQEFRFRGVRLLPRVSTTYSAGSGYAKLWIDDSILSATAPTYTDAFSRQAVDVQIAPASQPCPKRQELQWIASDVEDCDWINISASPTTFVPFSVCCFMGPTYVPGTSAGTGTNAADSVTVIMLDGSCRLEFRGLRQA